MPYGHLSAVVAMTPQQLIGVNNQLPWRLPADLHYFKQVTMGKPIVMGRKTYASIGKPLPGRLNVILSHSQTLDLPMGCQQVQNLEEIMQLTAHHAEVMIIGGAQVYALCLPHIQRLYITWVMGEFSGDTFFPAFDSNAWQQTHERLGMVDADNPHPHRFTILERI